MQPPCYIEIIGGLGNQLFQVATAFAHCMNNKYAIKIRSKPNCDRPSYWDTWLHRFANHIGTHVSDGSTWRDPAYNYTPINSSARNLYGYFQTWKYFESHKDLLLKLFTLPEKMVIDAKEKYSVFLSNKLNNCIIHVRRTDYFQGNNVGYHGILDSTYFTNAINRMREKNGSMQFHILSDDIDWCKTQTCFTDCTFIDEPNESIALWLMTQTPYIIMSNSTFSWWGAWLNPTSVYVIAPPKWHGPRGPQNDHDLYYPLWERVGVSHCYVQLIGGLCNQLFQVAAGYAHCRRNNLQLCISKTTEYRPVYWDTWLYRFLGHTSEPITNGPVWREIVFHYTPITSNSRYLYGFFQSSKYFSDVIDEIRSLFTIPDSIKYNIKQLYSNILTEEFQKNAIVIHVRRGDYLHGGNLIKHGILTEKYYDDAVAKIRSLNPTGPLLVFSDDLPWCRTQPYFSGAQFIDEPHDVKALWLMSQFCDYIMSNSTFSWWAVWLGSRWRHVIAPDRWFGSTGPQDYQDIYETDWIRIPAH